MDTPVIRFPPTALPQSALFRFNGYLNTFTAITQFFR
jgi:hypothetical protein